MITRSSSICLPHWLGVKFLGRVLFHLGIFRPCILLSAYWIPGTEMGAYQTGANPCLHGVYRLAKEMVRKSKLNNFITVVLSLKKKGTFFSSNSHYSFQGQILLCPFYRCISRGSKVVPSHTARNWFFSSAHGYFEEKEGFIKLRCELW